MSMKITEGQMDFLGLLSEYTDDQGATVRVREPGRKSLKPVIKAPEPEQLTIDFSEPVVRKEPKGITENETEPVIKTSQLVIEEAPKSAIVETPKSVINEEPKSVINEEPKSVLNDVHKKVEEKELKREKSFGSKTEMLFKQCKKCWCFDCRHNSRNEGVPREVCGMNIPCPPCDTCISEDCPTICEIGNAKEGCKLRATEEGIIVPDTETEIY